VLAMHTGELERRGLRARVDLDNALIKAFVDANQVRQVFLNLLRNAMDATRPGGEISSQLLVMDDFLVITVSDTGKGIPAVDRDRIFDLFFTTKPRGTGLGLAICRKIVQDHGGEISVESEEGKGTSFTIKLPCRPEAAVLQDPNLGKPL